MSTFFESIADSKKILVVDLGFLGDTIHLLPALRCIREALPEVQLDVVVGAHVASLLELTPWLDRVWSYPRFPTSRGLRWHLPFLKKLRAEGYAASINLNGSDRSSFLTRLSGAPLRLGRVPPKVAWYWPACFTQTVEAPFDCPLFEQRWQCLRAAGFPGQEPRFVAELPAAVAQSVEAKLSGERGFLHLSPFTTQDGKELPQAKLAELIGTLQQQYPERKIVLSAAPNEREQAKLAALLKALPVPPWRIFDGSLSLVELAGVIRLSAVHLGGDSGALHVALMTGRPTVSWWRDYPGRVEWQPRGRQHRTVLAEAGQALEDIDVRAVMEACADVLEAAR